MRSVVFQATLGLSLLASSLPLRAAGPPAAPAKSGLDRSHVDPQVRPQDDLFRHVNGKWLAESPIPADRPLDGAFYKLRDKSEADLRAIIEETAAKGDAAPGSEAQKVGDLFASFMDEARVEKLGDQPILEALTAIEQVRTKANLIALMARLGREGVDGTFGIGVDTDAKQSDRYIMYFGQSGLGLPDESYYRLEKFQPVREAYLAHIRKMFDLVTPGDNAKVAEQVMALETRLAKAHWDRVKSRDDTLTYNKKTIRELAELTPGFDWPLWFESTGAKNIAEVVVRQPSYFTAMARAMDEVPLATWKDWLKWSLLRNIAPFLSKPFVDENFSFYGKTLTGTQEIKPRWKRGVAAVEGSLGEAVGKLYVARVFPPAAKERMNQLVSNLTEAYRQDIQSLDLDEPRDQEEGAREAGQVHAQDRLSRRLARLLEAGDPPRRPRRQRPPLAGLRDRPPARQARQAGRPQRVGDDPADRQRLLQPGDERDRLPRRDLAAAVLRPRGRRRGELRRDRRRDRPRDRPRLRRPGVEVRRQRQPQRLVDRAPTARSSRPGPRS